MSDRARRLVWVDLEMTGLDPSVATIVEIATLITDEELRVIASGPELVIHASDEELAKMAPVVVEMHEKSGLTPRIRASTVTMEQAERETLAFLKEHVDERTAPLCGNSVWKDKQFLERYMPEVIAHMHYRLVDVSTIKELVRRWYPPSFAASKKAERHRALDDIHESIEELRLYRERVFVKAP
ncbi:MAG: oligoribonuclease [Polyangiaceae bacterium]|jgi:oligoribonuclease|nr:oligoribonuclease [Polyangiaceae bacterium]MBK8939778.1 oligoribonuclease [Polyangiaceae bacterium]